MAAFSSGYSKLSGVLESLLYQYAQLLPADRQSNVSFTNILVAKF